MPQAKTTRQIIIIIILITFVRCSHTVFMYSRRYQRSVARLGSTAITSPYRDAFSGAPVVTVSKAILSERYHVS